MYFTGEFFTLTTVVSVVGGFAINLTDIEVNDETSKNITGPLLLNLFDSLTNLTVDVDGLFDEFQEGFEDIRPANYSDLEEKNVTDNTPVPLTGSSIVVGLFDTLRDITGDVGDVVTDLGAGLTDKRQDVIEAAHHVDNKVGGTSKYSFYHRIISSSSQSAPVCSVLLNRFFKEREILPRPSPAPFTVGQNGRNKYNGIISTRMVLKEINQ